MCFKSKPLNIKKDSSENKKGFLDKFLGVRMGVKGPRNMLKSVKNRVPGFLLDVIISLALIGFGYWLGLKIQEPYPLIRRRLEEIVEEVPHNSGPIKYNADLVYVVKDYAERHFYSYDFTSKLLCDVAVPRMTSTRQMEEIMEEVLRQRNFTQEACDHISENIKLRVLDLNSTEGRGGIYCKYINTIFSYTRNQGTILHESAHSYWENLRKDEELRRDFVRDVVRLANMMINTLCMQIQ